MASAQYTNAPEVKDLAEKLVEKYHGHLTDFNVKLEYVFVDKTPKRNGKEVWATCRKISSINAFLAGGDDGSDPFFVIVVSEPVWDVLPPDTRLALVDHELCHAWAEANQKENADEADAVKLSLKPHDVEEFSCIIRRHGLWREDVIDFVDAALKAKEDEDAKEDATTGEDLD